MNKTILAAALAGALGVANCAGAIASGTEANNSGFSKAGGGAVTLIASNGSKGSEASCKGKEGSCKGAESSCKGKESSCKGKESSCKAKSESGAEKTCKVGGAMMYSSKDIIDNASNSPIHTTLVTAVKAAGLVDTLKGPGPFTVFAPTDEAFKKLPSGTVENLLKPENKADLAKILTYHVVSGKVSAEDLKRKIVDGGGTATLKTVQGEDLTAKVKGKKVELTDSKGNVAEVTQADVCQSNGVIHVINKVMMP